MLLEKNQLVEEIDTMNRLRECSEIDIRLLLKSRSYVLGLNEVETRKEVLSQVETAKEMVS